MKLPKKGGIAEFSVRNSLLVNLISIFIILVGAYSMMQMRREAFPPVEYDIVTVTTVWPGAPAEDVEKYVTIPLEKEIKSVSGLEEYTSKSDESLSTIGITLDPGTSDKRKVVRDIQRAVDRVQSLPDGVEEDPEVFELATREFPVIEISISGDVDEETRRVYAEDLRDAILDLPGVAQAREFGWRDKEFWVEVDPKKLKDYHVSMQEIMDALRLRNVTLPGGPLKSSVGEFNVRTTGEFRTPEEIAAVVIRANDAGNWLQVKDVAKVSETFEEASTLAGINRHPATAMVVVKTEQADAIKVVERINKTLDEFRKKLPEGMEITITNDFSYYVKRRLGVLKNNGMIGFGLVLLILFLFLDPIPAFMTAIGIPIALCLAFILMSIFDVTINLVSMLGLLLVLGMLVDDGIIVAENVYRYVEQGMDPKEAAIKGTNEVIPPVTITILTTFAAFGPLMFMDDIIGKFIRAIPMVVMMTLGSSLFEAFIILPSHLCDVFKFFKHDPTKHKEKMWYVKLKAFYNKSLTFALQHRYLVWNTLFLVFLFTLGLAMPLKAKHSVYMFAFAWIGGYFLVKLLRREFGRLDTIVMAICIAIFAINFNIDKRLRFLLFAGEGIEYVWIRGEGKMGTTLEQMEEKFQPVYDIIEQLPDNERDAYRSYIGGLEEERGFDPNSKRGSHLGQVTVFLTPMQKRDRTPQQIAAELREKIKSVEGFEKLYMYIPKEGPPTGSAVEIGIKGEDFETMTEIAKKYEAYLQKKEGVSDVNISYDYGKMQLKVNVDEEKAKKYYLSLGKVASSIRNVFKGGVATTVKPLKAEEEMDVLVRYPIELRDRREVFEDILIPNERGNLVPLKSVATIEETEGVYRIDHLDGKRVVYVTAQVDNKAATSLSVNQELQKDFATIEKDYFGYQVIYGGEFEDQQKSSSNLMASYLFALFLIFILLVAMFRSLIQPFIVMTAIPFGVVGVILSFWAHDVFLRATFEHSLGRPLNFFALMGLVGLTGIVVNDSVVLVDFINRMRKDGKDRRESIVSAGETRLRPVIMTSVTTIGGLVSVAYGIGGGDPFLKPMALAIVWGLVFSTGLTLVGIPCIYAIFDDFTEKVLHRSMVKQNGNDQDTRNNNQTKTNA